MIRLVKCHPARQPCQWLVMRKLEKRKIQKRSQRPFPWVFWHFIFTSYSCSPEREDGFLPFSSFHGYPGEAFVILGVLLSSVFTYWTLYINGTWILFILTIRCQQTWIASRFFYLALGLQARMIKHCILPSICTTFCLDFVSSNTQIFPLNSRVNNFFSAWKKFRLQLTVAPLAGPYHAL